MAHLVADSAPVADHWHATDRNGPALAGAQRRLTRMVKPLLQQAIAAAQGQAYVPTSLSELTGQASSGNPAEQIAAMAGDPASLMSRMSDMTPAQLEKLMNSV